MALDLFVLPARLLSSPSVDTSPRVNSAQFGDGYSQRAGDGLNVDPQVFSGQLQPVGPTIAVSLIAFFKAHIAIPFLWTLPYDTVQRKWIASKWSASYPVTGKQSISFTLTEVFDL